MTLSRLIQPMADGRLSGGYLYNARMAEYGAWELQDVRAPFLSQHVAALDPGRPTLLDSIWLTEELARPFIELAARGGSVGVMLHSFPSMIAAAESGAAPRVRPSEFELWALTQFGTCLVPGQHYADMLAGTAVRVSIIEPGIDDVWRAPPRRRSGPCRLVSVGAVTPRKGFLDVADALARRAPGDFIWTVIGSLDVDPAYAAKFLERTRSISAVEIAGQLDPAAVAARVRQADLLVMPSYDENQPLVVLEAMAASVPVVAYAAGATARMLEHEREGLVAPIGDRPLLGQHLQRLIDDEDERYAMAVASWQRQHQIPTWPEAAARARAAVGRDLGDRAVT